MRFFAPIAVLFLLPGMALAQEAAEAMSLPEAIDSVQKGYEAAGVLGAIGLGIAALVRFYKLAWLQSLLPAKARWSGWPRWAKQLTVFVVAAIPALVFALGKGMGWVAAATGALTSAATAMGVSEVGSVKKAGDKKEPA